MKSLYFLLLTSVLFCGCVAENPTKVENIVPDTYCIDCCEDCFDAGFGDSDECDECLLNCNDCGTKCNPFKCK